MVAMTEFTCSYCSKSFKRQETVDTHKCERRSRYQSQNTTESRIAFNTFQTFYHATTKTFDDFAASSYYKAFSRFGEYCVQVKVISPEDYAKWLIKNKKRIDDWNKDTLYTAYLVDYLPTEPVGPALTRSIKAAVNWAEKNSAPSHDWLRYGNLTTIAYSITTGKLSGWALYNSASGHELLTRLSDSPLLDQCWPYVDSEKWARTFKSHTVDQTYAKDIMQQAGW